MRARVLGAMAAAVLCVAAAGKVTESPALPPDKIPAAIQAAVDSGRPDADKALDAGRQPAQMLAFFGVSPGMKVARALAGNSTSRPRTATAVGESSTRAARAPAPSDTSAASRPVKNAGQAVFQRSSPRSTGVPARGIAYRWPLPRQRVPEEERSCSFCADARSTTREIQGAGTVATSATR